MGGFVKNISAISKAQGKQLKTILIMLLVLLIHLVKRILNQRIQL